MYWTHKDKSLYTRFNSFTVVDVYIHAKPNHDNIYKWTNKIMDLHCGHIHSYSFGWWTFFNKIKCIQRGTRNSKVTCRPFGIYFNTDIRQARNSFCCQRPQADEISTNWFTCSKLTMFLHRRIRKIKYFTTSQVKDDLFLRFRVCGNIGTKYTISLDGMFTKLDLTFSSSELSRSRVGWQSSVSTPEVGWRVWPKRLMFPSTNP